MWFKKKIKVISIDYIFLYLIYLIIYLKILIDGIIFKKTVMVTKDNSVHMFACTCQ